MPRLATGLVVTLALMLGGCGGGGSSGGADQQATVPDAPVIGSAAAGNSQATVAFTAPSIDGGSAITSYTVTSSPGAVVATGASSPITVTGLTNGTAYTFSVTATNAVGTSAASGASNSVTPSAGAAGASTVPGAPTIGTATAGNGQASISFSAPASNGGSAITVYTVTSSPGAIVGSGASSPIIVTGLTNGTSYTFSVTASNAVGTSATSAASNGVTPSAGAGSGPTVPGAPTIGTATAGNGQATVSFSPPASSGGSAITGYTVTSSPGAIVATGASGPIIVTGLTNGTAYTFFVTATNAVGVSATSAASNSVTPSAGTGSGPAVPGAPTIGTATAGNGQASLSFSPPASNGGSAITGYTVTSSPGAIVGRGASSPIVVIGLTNGAAYTFSVTASNGVGTSAASAASNSVTPSASSGGGPTAPGAPTIGTANAGDGQATVSFTPPSSNGGSAVTGYSVISSPGGISASGSASPITVSGLTDGTTYTFTVKAINAIGSSLASAASNSVTPFSSSPLGCGTVQSTGTGNTVPLVVDGFPCAAAGGAGQNNDPNEAFISVQVCAPGSTTNCQIIDHVTVDTGSTGLRFASSAVASALQPGTAGGLPVTAGSTAGTVLTECETYGGSYVYGPVVTADIYIAGKQLKSLPIQIFGQSGYTVPAGCTSQGGSNTPTPSSFGGNGLIGVGFDLLDQTPYFNCDTSAVATCTDSNYPGIPNPVSQLSADNNGILIDLPSVGLDGSTTPVIGTLYFGVATQSNNSPTSASVGIANDSSGYFAVSTASTWTSAYIDSGTDILYFADSSDSQLTTCGDHFCPSTPQAITIDLADAGSKTTLLQFPYTVGNADTVYGSHIIASESAAGPTSDSFAFGLSTFFGHKMYFLYNGQTAPGTGLGTTATVTGPINGIE
jgi:trimeric autotransporter adhesin